MSPEGVFSGRLLAIWVSASVVLLTLSLYFMLKPDVTSPEGTEIGPSVFSRSALGYAGIAEILQRVGLHVVKSRSGLGRLRGDDLLVIAEPEGALDPQDVGITIPSDAERVLLILPKREGTPSQSHPGWISDSNLMPEAEIQSILDAVRIDATIAYTRKPVVWSKNAFGVDPQMVAPVQLIRSHSMEPSMASQRGALLAWFEKRRYSLWVLADPDVLENQGMAHAANAAFAVALFQRLTGPGGRVVFDEAIHGYVSQGASPLLILVTFPYVLATAQGVLAICLLLWATVGRFGKAEPLAPALAAGKLGLIGNIAELLGFAGHQEVVVQRYVQETLRDVARLLHAPTLPEGKLVPWLSRIGAMRGIDMDCADILRRLEERSATGARAPLALMAVARDIYRWKREIIDGRAGHSLAGGRHPRRDP
jgi:hypothetical protein